MSNYSFVFAIYPVCQKAITHQTRNLSVLNKTRHMFPDLLQGSIAVTEKAWGLGMRRAYSSTISEYMVKGVQRKGKNKHLSTLKPHLWRQLIGVCRNMDELLCECFPQHAIRRMRVIKRRNLRTVAKTWCTNLYGTSNYLSAPHTDRDDGHMAAVAFFYEAHEAGCVREQEGESCVKDWQFIFPEWKLVILIQDGTVIFWDSEHHLHRTCCSSNKMGCQSDRLVLVSQLRQNLTHYKFAH